MIKHNLEQEATNMKKIVIIMISLLFISIIGLFFTISPTKAETQTIYVDDSNTTGPWNGTLEHPYQNITSALTYASAGYKIFVYNGTYYEHLIISKSVALIGQDKNGTIIDGNQTGDVIKITANNVNITEFTIQNSGSTSGESGIHVYSSSSNNINHNIIKNNYNGIFLYDSNNNTLTNNSISNNYYGISLSASNTNTISENTISSNSKSGIYVSDSSNATISDNNILKNDEFGVAFIASSNSRFTGNDISLNNKYGIYLFSSANNIFSGNNISSNQESGIWLSKSTNNLLADNIFSNDKFGIYVTNSTHNIFTKNNIYTNIQHGIRLDYSINNTISGNDISKNWIRGILLYYSSNNTIFHNNFINNTGSLTNINSTNYLDNGIEGNYWSNYNGTDENQDGIGNSPYIIDEDNQDKYPLMGTFSDFPVTYQEKIHHILTISNSTILQFGFDQALRMLSFNITNQSNTGGFCRITIPEQLSNSPYVVLVDNETINATVLPGSNITHTVLHFTYNESTREIRILPKQFYDLLQTYKALLEQFNTLDSIYHQLLHEYNALNQTLQQAVANYTNISSLFDALNQTYQETLNNYTKLQDQHQLFLHTYETLNQTFWQGQANFTQLLSAYNTLNQTYTGTMNSYTALMNQYEELRSQYEQRESEFAVFRTALTGVSVATVAVAVITSSLIIKYHRLAQAQKELAEKYRSELERISLIDTARAQFEADAKRRKEKIRKFQNKYGVTVRPRDTLEDIITSLELKKEKTQQ